MNHLENTASDPWLAEDGAGATCRAILKDLPEWFGEPTAVERYADAAQCNVTYLAGPRSAPVGIITLKQHFKATVEILLLAVRRAHHREGLGSALVLTAERFARAAGAGLLMVKTLGPSNPDPNYAATRKFYAARGFLPLEELHTLWRSPPNPCLILVKALP